jgi:predicted dehydrogenase
VLRVFEPGRYLTCDFAAGVLTTAAPETDPAARTASPIGRQTLTVEMADSLEAEIAAFVAAAAAGTPAPIDGARGLAALEIALAIREEARAHRGRIAARRARRATGARVAGDIR